MERKGPLVWFLLALGVIGYILELSGKLTGSAGRLFIGLALMVVAAAALTIMRRMQDRPRAPPPPLWTGPQLVR